MGKWLKKHWKFVLILAATSATVNFVLYLNRGALVYYAGVKLVDAQTADVDPDKLTVADFKDIPDVTREYVDAYKIFLKAQNYRDKSGPGYADAAAAFDKIAATTANPELKLRSLYLVTFCNFLQRKIDNAYKSGQQVIALSKQLYPKDSRVIMLDKIVEAVNKGTIRNINSLKKGIAGEESAVQFAEELNALTEACEDFDKMQGRYEFSRFAKKEAEKSAK